MTTLRGSYLLGDVELIANRTAANRLALGLPYSKAMNVLI